MDCCSTVHKYPRSSSRVFQKKEGLPYFFSLIYPCRMQQEGGWFSSTIPVLSKKTDKPVLFTKNKKEK
jgi:hypothetical protein